MRVLLTGADGYTGGLVIAHPADRLIGYGPI